LPIRDNKFARLAEHRNRNKILDDEPTVEEKLARLEEDIRRLKIEFDIYFNGASKRPPYDTKSRVETLIKRLGDDRTLSYAQRYHYNSLAARYHAFRDLWRRTMQEREEGRDPISKSARAVSSEVEELAEPAAVESPAQTESMLANNRSDKAKPVIFVCADPRKDVRTVKELFDAFVEAKKKCGEPADDMSFPRFHHLIATKADALKQRVGCERVRFSIDIDGGRVSFKAKGDRE
jgi:hypothetical protein